MQMAGAETMCSGSHIRPCGLRGTKASRQGEKRCCCYEESGSARSRESISRLSHGHAQAVTPAHPWNTTCSWGPSVPSSRRLQSKNSKYKVLTGHLLNEGICPHGVLIHSRPQESFLNGMLIWRTIITIKLFLSETERPSWQAPESRREEDVRAEAPWRGPGVTSPSSLFREAPSDRRSQA